jgi:hypothetical protein
MPSSIMTDMWSLSLILILTITVALSLSVSNVYALTSINNTDFSIEVPNGWAGFTEKISLMIIT